MIIKPITVRLIVYGQKANVSAIRTRAAALLKDEHGTVDEACFVELPAAKIHAEIETVRLDHEADLKKPGAAMAGLTITLPEVNERSTSEWLDDLPVAKTCVVLATWASGREPVAWQMLIIQGDRCSESRAI